MIKKLVILLALVGCSPTDVPSYMFKEKVIVTSGMHKDCIGLILGTSDEDESRFQIKFDFLGSDGIGNCRELGTRYIKANLIKSAKKI